MTVREPRRRWRFPLALTVSLLAGSASFTAAQGPIAPLCDEWADLGGGVHGGGAAFQIFALTVYRGDLIAGGTFTQIGGQLVNRVARWDGEAWHPLGEGFNVGVLGEDVRALTVYEGDLIVGGTFTHAAGQPANRIARWDGESWHPFVAGGVNGMSDPVHALTVYEGDLIAGGLFTRAGAETVNRIARWDGATWLPFVSEGIIGVSGTAVSALLVHDGMLVAGGNMVTAGPVVVNRVAGWNGETWRPFVVGGISGVNAPVFSLTRFDGALVIGGQFGTAGGALVNSIARWDGDRWRPFGPGMNLSVFALNIYQDDLIAGGQFSTTSDRGQVLNGIARWRRGGTFWEPFVAQGEIGMSTPNSSVRTLAIYRGDLVAGGSFNTAGGEFVGNIARWGDCGVEPPQAGDANCDGVISAADVVALVRAIGSGSRAPCMLDDVNGDGILDAEDIDALLAAIFAS
jgi:hypothetical protein